MDHSFSFITSLQYQLKAALAQLAAFQSGKKYQDMQEAHHKEVHSLKQKGKNRRRKNWRELAGIWFVLVSIGLKYLKIWKRNIGMK